MKFEPTKDSTILALNCSTREEDLELISRFYDGVPVELIGYWQNQEERSYQLLAGRSLNITSMIATCRENNQEAIISIAPSGAVFMHQLDTIRFQELGRMTQIPTKEECCTYCPSTLTYWKAI